VRRFDRNALLDVARLLRSTARAEIMPRFRRLGAGDVHMKTGPLDLVTVADVVAERVIEAGLQRLFPGAIVVGEEGTAADPTLLDRLAGAALAFVVDPVDGTANYVAGLPLFGTMAAAIEGGEVVAAVIHDPVLDDTAFALAGEGAWIEAADGSRRDLRVAAAVKLAEMSGAMAWRQLPEAVRQSVATRLPLLAASWDYRCAAHEYRMLAGGHCHYLMFNKLMPWDHAPGWLLHREAGGFAARFDGTPYRAATDFAGGLICTPDEASFRALRDALLRP
jgi:fructose-1,6-bisphosphatase/inositol monophosphatase family enzyme